MYFSLIDNSKPTHKTIFDYYTFEYSSLENLIKSTSILSDTSGYKILESSLYLNPSSKKYYLTLTVIEDQNQKILSVLKEFSKFRQKGHLIHSFIDEHFKSIIKNNAIQVLYNYFK